jgi:hypothetical protein
MSDGMNYCSYKLKDPFKKCWDKIYKTVWKKIENGYLIETKVSPDGVREVKKTKLVKEVITMVMGVWLLKKF